MISKGRNDGFRVLDDFVCEAIHGPDVPRADEQHRGRNEGMLIIEDLSVEASGEARERKGILKKVIALSGAANRGKTETIRKAYDVLLAEYPSAQQDYLINRTDVRVILTIDGIRIGIESQGDPNSRLQASLDLFVREGCEVIVCATRTSGMTVEAVNHLRNSYKLVRLTQVAKQQPSEQASRNLQMATRIVAEVKQVVAHNNALKMGSA